MLPKETDFSYLIRCTVFVWWGCNCTWPSTMHVIFFQVLLTTSKNAVHFLFYLRYKEGKIWKFSFFCNTLYIKETCKYLQWHLYRCLLIPNWCLLDANLMPTWTLIEHYFYPTWIQFECKPSWIIIDAFLKPSLNRLSWFLNLYWRKLKKFLNIT